MEINFDVKEKDLSVIVDDVKTPEKIDINMSDIIEMFKKAEICVSNLSAIAEELEVKDAVSRNTAIEMGTQAKSMFRILDNKRQELKKPYLAIGQKLDGLLRPIKSTLTSIEGNLKKKIKVNLDEENRKRIEKERKENEIAEEKELKRLEVAKALCLSTEEIPAPEPVTKIAETVIPSKHVTQSGSAGYKKVWKFRVTDKNSVPLQYLFVDEKMIELAIKNGVREIKGIEIYEDSEVNFTSARKGGPFNG